MLSMILFLRISLYSIVFNDLGIVLSPFLPKENFLVMTDCYGSFIY